MKRTLLGIVAVAALGATLVSTGAFVDTVELDSTEDKIEMEPSDGPNAVYAVEDSDGEIKLDLSESNQHLAGEGINEGSLTEIPNIFTVNYSAAAGEPAAEVWFTSDADEGIKFVVGTDSVDSIDGNDSKRTLPPDEKLHIGVIVDTRGDHDVESVSEFTIHVVTAGVEEQAPEEEGETVPDTIVTDDTTQNEADSSGENDGTQDSEDTEQVNETEDDEIGQDDSEETETVDTGGNESEPNDGDIVGNETTDDSDQNGGDGNGEEGANGDNGDGGDGNGEVGANDDNGDGGDGNGEEGANDNSGDGGNNDIGDGAGFQTTGQGPSFPGPEETLGGFLSGTFLWLIVAVLLGATLFAATRYGTERFGGEA